MAKDIEEEIGKKVDQYSRTRTTLADRYHDKAIKGARTARVNVLEHSMNPWMLPMSFVVMISVFTGAYVILPGEGFWHHMQSAMMAGLAGWLSLMCNKQLFHKAAPAVANGCIGSTISSVAYLTVMVVMVGSLGFTGLSFDSVESDKRRQALFEIQRAEQLANQSSIGASGIGPIVVGIASWAEATATSEENDGGVSGRRGAGPVTRKLRAIAARIRGVASAFRGGDQKRVAIAKRLQNIASEYETELGGGGASKESRAKLVKIYSRAQSLVTELENAVPVTALKSLVGELRSMDVPPAKAGRINVKDGLLGHADRLEKALGGVGKSSVTLAAFPRPSFVAEGWNHIDRFWIYAVIAYGLELAWSYVWFQTVLEIRDRMRKAHRDRNGDGMRSLRYWSDDDDHGADAVAPMGIPDRQHHLKVYGQDAARQLKGGSDV